MDDLRRALEREVARVADRLRELGQARLQQPVGEHASRAEAGRWVAQALADAAQELEAATNGTLPGRRELPRLSDFAVGDQVAVTGTDLLLAYAAVPPDAAVPSPEPAPRTPDEVLAAALSALRDVRRLL